MAEAAVVQVKIADLPQVQKLIGAVRALDATVQAVYDIDPESHATKSRDYGRGFAEALRVVRSEIDSRMSEWGDTVRRPAENEPPTI